MIDQVSFLVKFMKKERVHNFVNEGVIFMHPLKYFRDYEEQEVIGDKNEGKYCIFNGNNTKIEIEGKIIGGVIRGDIQYPYEECINVFCMTAIRDSMIQQVGKKHILKFNEPFGKFGDTAIIIPRNNIPTYMKKIETAFKKNRYLSQLPEEEDWAGRVGYVDDNFSGKYGPFKKNVSQAWQSEWRIAFIRKAKLLKPKPYKFKIGSISDISLEIPTDELIYKGIRIV